MKLAQILPFKKTPTRGNQAPKLDSESTPPYQSLPWFVSLPLQSTYLSKSDDDDDDDDVVVVVDEEIQPSPLGWERRHYTVSGMKYRSQLVCRISEPSTVDTAHWSWGAWDTRKISPSASSPQCDQDEQTEWFLRIKQKCDLRFVDIASPIHIGLTKYIRYIHIIFIYLQNSPNNTHRVGLDPPSFWRVGNSKCSAVKSRVWGGGSFTSIWFREWSIANKAAMESIILLRFFWREFWHQQWGNFEDVPRTWRHFLKNVCIYT